MKIISRYLEQQEIHAIAEQLYVRSDKLAYSVKSVRRVTTAFSICKNECYINEVTLKVKTADLGELNRGPYSTVHKSCDQVSPS